MPQQINLIDPSLQPPPQRLSPALLLVTLGLGVSVVASHFVWEKMWLAHELAAATASAPVEQEAGADVSASAPDTTALDRLAQREALRDLLRQQVAMPDGSATLIADILRVLPDQVWLTELELGAQRSLRISGGTLDTAGFGLLSTRLTSVAALQGIPLHTVRLQPQPTQGGDGEPAAAPQSQLFVLASTPAGVAAFEPGAGAGANR